MSNDEIIQIFFGIAGIALILLIITKFFGKKEEKNNYGTIDRNTEENNNNSDSKIPVDNQKEEKCFVDKGIDDPKGCTGGNADAEWVNKSK